MPCRSGNEDCDSYHDEKERELKEQLERAEAKRIAETKMIVDLTTEEKNYLENMGLCKMAERKNDLDYYEEWRNRTTFFPLSEITKIWDIFPTCRIPHVSSWYAIANNEQELIFFLDFQIHYQEFVLLDHV